MERVKYVRNSLVKIDLRCLSSSTELSYLSERFLFDTSDNLRPAIELVANSTILASKSNQRAFCDDYFRLACSSTAKWIVQRVIRKAEQRIEQHLAYENNNDEFLHIKICIFNQPVIYFHIRKGFMK
jgi:hypothetical protein